MFRIVEDKMPPLPESCSTLLEDFLKQCFNKEPTLRPSADILFEHPWLKQNWGAHKVLIPPSPSRLPHSCRVFRNCVRRTVFPSFAASVQTSRSRKQCGCSHKSRCRTGHPTSPSRRRSLSAARRLAVGCPASPCGPSKASLLANTPSSRLHSVNVSPRQIPILQVLMNV